MEMPIDTRKIFIKRKLCYKRISMKRTLPSRTYCEWISEMETNFLIITVVTIVGMSIPIVICCLFFTVCDPSISRVGKVSILLFEFMVYYHYIALSLFFAHYVATARNEKKLPKKYNKNINWNFVKNMSLRSVNECWI